MLIRSPGTRGRRTVAVGDAAFAVGRAAFAFAVGDAAVIRGAGDVAAALAAGDGLDTVATDTPCTESRATGIAANRMARTGPCGVFRGYREILT
jgi:hypothetical protein